MRSLIFRDVDYVIDVTFLIIKYTSHVLISHEFDLLTCLKEMSEQVKFSHVDVRHCPCSFTIELVKIYLFEAHSSSLLIWLTAENDDRMHLDIVISLFKGKPDFDCIQNIP